jgi:hypothetical protein
MKYKVGAKKYLEESGNVDRELDDNADLGKSEIEIQIAQLDAEIVKAKRDVRAKEEAYTKSKYAMPFSLAKVDSAEHSLNLSKIELKRLEEDRKSRVALKKELFD